MLRLRTILVVPVVLLLVSPAWADFSGLSSNGFTYCYVHFESLDGDTCSRRELALGGNCESSCSASGAWGDVSGFRWWQIDGEGNAFSAGDEVFQSWANVWAQRIDAETLRVHGNCAGGAGNPQIALFRFDGDPSVFDGTSAIYVAELVGLGLIDAADVIWVRSCTSDGAFSYDVDAPGVPDEELVVFAAAATLPGPGSGGQPVPAISSVGAIALTFLLIGCGAILLRRRV